MAAAAAAAATAAPRVLRVLQYNLLLEELSSNFNPRTMRDPSPEQLQRAFSNCCAGGAVAAPPEAPAERWAALRAELGAEYRLWHPLKDVVLDPSGAEARIRSLWGEPDLLALSKKGWDLRGLAILSATQLGEPSGAPKTLLGLLKERLGIAEGEGLYQAIQEVHESSCVWTVRSSLIMKKIKEAEASLVVLEEYDMHELPTAGHSSFREAMASLGYEGLCCRGPGQAAMGVGLFWRRQDLTLPIGARLPESRVLRSGEDLGFAANLDMEEPGFRDMDRRSLGLVRLITGSGQPVLLCGVHLMTTSRDRGGEVRAFELTRLREFISPRATAQDAVLLCGDFNIDMRGRREEHVWSGCFGSPCEPRCYDTGYVRSEDADMPLLRWRRADGSELRLRDAFGDVDALDESSSTRTGTRLETIDYVFHDEARLSPLLSSRSELRCPEEPMPNASEPSDHIPLVAAFRLEPPPPTSV